MSLRNRFRPWTSVAQMAALMACCLAARPASTATVDAVVGPGEYGPPLAVQNTPTAFGNADGFGGPGSELNAAYANLRGDGGLELMLTGNLETNGNAIVIFFDTRGGGAVVDTLAGGYGLLGAFGGQRTDDWDSDGGEGVFTPSGGSILDPGFDPDFAIEFNISGGNRHVNVIDLTVGGNHPSLVNRDVYLGATPEFALATTQDYFRDSGTAPSGQVTHDYVNFNGAGVNGYDSTTPPGPLGDPLSAEFGLEFHFSPEVFNADEDRPIHIMAFITNGGGDFLSNQFLPGLGGVNNPGGVGNPGGEPLFDAREFAGNQYFTVPARIRGDYNGNGFVDAADYTVWRNTNGTAIVAGEGADGDRDGEVTPADYLEWKSRYGNSTAVGAGRGAENFNNVPEPSGVALCVLAMLATLFPRSIAPR